MTNFLAGDVSGAQVLTDDDHIYPQLWNELRQSRGVTAVVGLTSECEYYCDGTPENNRLQIQAALNAVGDAGGGVVYVKTGTYSLDKFIWVPSYVTLEGEGWNTIFKLADGAYSGHRQAVVFPIGLINTATGEIAEAADFATTYGAVLRNFKVDANRAGITGLSANLLYGVQFQWVNGATIDNLFVINAHSSGIGVWGSNPPGAFLNAESYVTRCRAENNNASVGGQTLDSGIFVSNGTGLPQRVIVSDCISKGNRNGYGVEDSTGGVSFNNCIGAENWNHGLTFHTASHSTVNGGFFYLNDLDGISTTGSGERWHTINGVHCYRNKRYGITVGHDYSINGGQFVWNDDAGIVLSSAYNNTITGAMICGNGAGDAPTYPYGIYAVQGAVSSYNVISGCVIGQDYYSKRSANSQTHGIFESGACSNVITGNSFSVYGTTQTPFQRGVNSATKIRNNLGYVSENSGTSTITSANTSVVVTHGLSVTPTLDDITITGGENPTTDIGTIWVDTLGATTFKVNCEVAPSTSNFTFGWKAIVL